MSKIKNIRDLYKGINDFKKGYQPRFHRVQNDKGDLVTECQSISAKWRNQFSQLFNVVYMGLVMLRRQIHPAETLEPEPKCL